MNNIALTLIMLCVPLSAYSATYQYINGNSYDWFGSTNSVFNTSNRITGSFTVESALQPNFSGLIAPTKYSFTDGRTVFSGYDEDGFTQINVSTDALGIISEWDIIFSDDDTLHMSEGDVFNRIFMSSQPGGWDGSDIFECFRVDTAGTCAGATLRDLAGVQGMPGSWNVVPIPAAAWLLGSALLVLGVIKRKRT